MNHRNAAFSCAFQAASRLLACTPRDLRVVKEASTHLEEKQFGRLMALIGDTCLIKAGHSGSFPQQLYCRLWTASTWEPSFNALVEPVYDALASSRCKQANMATTLTNLTSARGRGAGATDGVLGLLTALALTGGVVGSGLGALNWHLKRTTQGDDENVEELDSKADFYRQMAEQINTDSRLRRWQQGVQ